MTIAHLKGELYRVRRHKFTSLNCYKYQLLTYSTFINIRFLYLLSH